MSGEGANLAVGRRDPEAWQPFGLEIDLKTD